MLLFNFIIIYIYLHKVTDAKYILFSLTCLLNRLLLSLPVSVSCLPSFHEAACVEVHRCQSHFFFLKLFSEIQVNHWDAYLLFSLPVLYFDLSSGGKNRMGRDRLIKDASHVKADGCGQQSVNVSAAGLFNS